MSFDVDIDCPPDFKPESLFPSWIRASVLKNEELTPHPCGIYPQAIAKDLVTGLAAIPYDTAEELGYFKLDMLHLNTYQHFSSREEILELIEIEPNWSLLQSPSIVAKLFQLGRHLELLQKIRPKSIEEIADVLALIRPGKYDLLQLYLTDKFLARQQLYKKDAGGFAFKKSHAISYALVVVLQLHLAEADLL